MDTNKGAEKRRSRRNRKSDALYWSFSKQELPEMGWMLESSDEGLAFAWRGAQPPNKGTIIHLRLNTPMSGTQQMHAVVRRMSVAHEDLAIIAVELVDLQPFPPASNALASEITNPPIKVSAYSEPPRQLAA